jgi:UPF0755 protein
MRLLSSSDSKTSYFLYRLLFVVVFLIFYVFLGLYGRMHTKGPYNHSVTIKIQQGDNLQIISKQLYDLGLIRSPFLFSLYVRYTQRDRSLKRGQYVFTPHTSEASVAEAIFKGMGMYYRVFLPEGYTTLRMLNSIKKYRFFDRDKFKTPAEGALFPDTYRVESGTKYSDFIQLMEARMKDAIVDAWRKRENGLYFKTPEEMLIAASLIEKETFLKTERPVIASVIVNRLRKGMRLQIDPTVIYGLSKTGLLGRPLTRKDLKIVTPYNTYRKNGLPPTPICNPGVKSLLAAADPANTNHIYYVATGKGGHNFAHHYDDHLRNIKVMKQNLKNKPVPIYRQG